jgi:predicted MPP superfamily phosphohydrolase
MRPNLLSAVIGIVIVIAVMLLIELYAFKSIAVSLDNAAPLTRKLVIWGYWLLTAATFTLSILAMVNFRQWRSDHPTLLMVSMAAFMVIGAPKLVLASFHLLDDLRLGFQWVGSKLMTSGVSASTDLTDTGTKISRSTFITRVGYVGAGLTFASFLYGVTLGKYKFRVLDHTVPLAKLPVGFAGWKVVQISDAHLGSFLNDREPIEKSIELINSLNPDLILFTGDLVNVEASEAEPWIDVFAKLKARHGKFSILGNHDYADYGAMTDEQRAASRKRIIEIHREMGFDLLMNENRILESNGDRMALVGVENWGKGFKQQGDLPKALRGTENIDCRILLSHDPTHWEEQVLGKEQGIQLTLSGHTHGMQMGIEIPAIGLKFSPARLRYRRWGGLYTEGSQHLHVNRGFGFIGFPGRVGMPPEITLLNLQQA